MPDPILLIVDGEVESPVRLTFADLTKLDVAHQVPDVSQLDPKRRGSAVTLSGILSLVRAKPSCTYIGLHSDSDNFHASIPLAAVRERAILIYRLDDQPLPAAAGGPVRFLIPDYAACHTHEIDECANVKFVDHIELTAGRGYDNRPADDAAHAKLHGGASR